MHTATPTHPPHGLWMAANCPTCAAGLTLTNPGATNGRETKAIARCAAEPRHGEWLITCRIDQVAPTATRKVG